MPLMLETVTADGLPPILSVDGISVSVEQAVRTATLTLDPTRGIPQWGAAATVKASGDLLLTGYIRDVKPAHGEGQRSLAVTVCSRTVDATECSCDHDGGEILRKDLKAIGKELDKLGIGIVAEGDMPSFARHKLMTGETLFSTLERRARASGTLIMDTPQGKLKLASKPSGRHSGGLVLGRNIEQASASFSEQGRHSKVKVRGQSPDGVNAAQLRPEAVATDSAVTRARPLIVLHDGEATVTQMKTRAAWLVRRAAGYSVTAQVTVTGWRDGAGKLWEPNFLVPVDDELIGLQGDMLIKAVTFSQNPDSGGTIAVIDLVDPRAMGGKNPRGKSAKAWAAPSDTQAEFNEED